MIDTRTIPTDEDLARVRRDTSGHYVVVDTRGPLSHGDTLMLAQDFAYGCLCSRRAMGGLGSICSAFGREDFIFRIGALISEVSWGQYKLVSRDISGEEPTCGECSQPDPTVPMDADTIIVATGPAMDDGPCLQIARNFAFLWMAGGAADFPGKRRKLNTNRLLSRPRHQFICALARLLGEVSRHAPQRVLADLDEREPFNDDLVFTIARGRNVDVLLASQEWV